ncbi:MAG: pyridoxine 5'-phosphate synthase [Candidatus Omnitrophica bacterium]|nr:pyridoxine 5'-phosphate synthase [Candidatus Omnitrophota bacterium]
MPRLGVNIDHVATIRQARKTVEPDPSAAALIAENAGADGITVHLREDRRHINDRDVKLLRKTIKSRLNLEMSINPLIVKIACQIKPDQATLVPEKRQEITTEGGLDIIAQEKKIKNIVNKLKLKGIWVSLFVEADRGQLKAAKRVNADAIELHTGTYANAKTETSINRQLDRLLKAAKLAKSLDLHVYAGHGLNYQNTAKLLKKIPEIEELNIGHSIVSRAVLNGMDEAVRTMKVLIQAI